MKRLAAILLFSISSFSPSVAQENCDCSRYVSDCTAEAHLDEESATVELKTDAKICAKVDFMIDVTGYTAVFSGGATTGPVILFRGRPLAAGVRACHVCVNTDKAAKGPTDDAAAPKTLAEYLQGSWYYGQNEVTAMYTFGADASGSSKHINPLFPGEGRITCSGEPSKFSCGDAVEVTTDDGQHLTWNMGREGSRIDYDTFTFGNGVIFTRR